MPDKKERIDIHEYLAEFDDIPGTRCSPPSARARATTSTSSACA